MASSRCRVSCGSPCGNLNAAMTASYDAASRSIASASSSAVFRISSSAAESWSAYPACDFFFRESPATICPSAAASAPANAETLPPHLRERSEEHTSELQSRSDLVCRLLLEKKKKKINQIPSQHH